MHQHRGSRDVTDKVSNFYAVRERRGGKAGPGPAHNPRCLTVFVISLTRKPSCSKTLVRQSYVGRGSCWDGGRCLSLAFILMLSRLLSSASRPRSPVGAGVIGGKFSRRAAA